MHSDGLKLRLDIILRDFSRDMGTPTHISAENDGLLIPPYNLVLSTNRGSVGGGVNMTIFKNHFSP